MTTSTPPSAVRHHPDEALRSALLRALTTWCEDPVAAEDLTQQTLLAAWTSDRQPEADEDWRRWLFGIARNILLRWRRDQARHGRRLATAPENESQLMAASTDDVIDMLADRADIVAILDGALARIPAESRRALLLRYVDDLPQREVAARLGIGEGALEGKLHRGKRAMSRILLTERADLAVEMGLLSDRDAWFQTGLWCEQCGQHQLVARWTLDGDLWVDCPACAAAPMNGARSCVIRTFDAYQGVKPRFGDPRSTPFRAAYRAVMASIYDPTADGLDTRRACPRCGGDVRVSVVDYDDMPSDLKMQCTWCLFIDCWGWSTATCSSHPLVRSWLNAQRRTRMTTQTFITTVDNRPATLMRYESLTSGSTITAWRDLGTMKFVMLDRDGISLPLTPIT